MNPDMLIIVYLNYDNISINQKGAGEVEGLWLSGFVNLLWPMRTKIPHSMNSSACYNKSVVTTSCTALLCLADWAVRLHITTLDSLAELLQQRANGCSY